MSYALVAAGVMIAGTAVSAKMSSDASNAAAGRAIQQNTYESVLQQHTSEMEQKAMIQASKEQALKILSSAQFVRSAQVAQNAGNGVLIGEGSSQTMQDRTTELAMSDALATLYSGARGSFKSQVQSDFNTQRLNSASASAAAQNASNQSAIAVNATTSILSTAVGAYGKSTTPSTKTT